MVWLNTSYTIILIYEQLIYSTLIIGYIKRLNWFEFSLSDLTWSLNYTYSQLFVFFLCTKSQLFVLTHEHMNLNIIFLMFESSKVTHSIIFVSYETNKQMNLFLDPIILICFNINESSLVKLIFSTFESN